MINCPGNSIQIVIAAVIGLSFSGGGLRAERKILQSSTEVARELSRNVYEIDNLADQMAIKYDWELRYNNGCRDSVLLYRHLQKHSILTKDLVRAFRVGSGVNFHKLASQVRESLCLIENLQKRARVSQGVSRLIGEATQKAAFIFENSNSFQPEQAYPRLKEVSVNQTVKDDTPG